MVLFIVAIIALRDQPFIDPVVLLVSLIVAIVGTVTIDAVVVARSRMSYVSGAVLPKSGDAQ
jgi:hypothetical protein